MSDVLSVARDMYGLFVNDCLNASYNQTDDTVSLIQGPINPEIKCSEKVLKARDEFLRLSSLDGDVGSLSNKDLELLRRPEALASFIAEHPAFEVVCDPQRNAFVLKMGAKNVDYIGGVDYKRFVYFVQLALNTIVPDAYQIKKPNGSYGKGTALAVNKFWQMIDLEDDRKGELIGKETLKKILLHTKYNKKTLIEKLKSAGESLAEKGNYLSLESKSPEHDLVIDAMMWLGWAEYRNRNWAQHAIQKKWEEHHGGNAYLMDIGPNVINWMISEIEKTEFR